MKHRMWLIPVLGGLAAVLWLAIRADEPRPLRQAAESVRDFVGADRARPGVVATVDGAPIYLRQVEALYDMNSVSPGEGRNVTLDEVRADYAAQLDTLIVQALIRKELAARNLSVDDADVRKLEALVSSGYDENPGPDFDPYIEDAGLAPDMWREQLRARLELERWQAELAKSLTVTAGDVESYIQAHPGEMTVPEQVDYLLVSGGRQADVEAARKSDVVDPAALQARGLDVRRFRRPVGAVPDVWAKDLTELAAGHASPVRSTGTAWRYVAVIGRFPARARTAGEAYAHVEGLLTEKKLPEVFDAWLEQAVGRADIRMAGALLPRNVPKPAPRPALPLPRTHSSTVPADQEGQDGTDMLDGMGEVETDLIP